MYFPIFLRASISVFPNAKHASWVSSGSHPVRKVLIQQGVRFNNVDRRKQNLSVMVFQDKNKMNTKCHTLSSPLHSF